MNDFFVRTGSGVRVTLPGGLVEFLQDVPTALDLVGKQDDDPAATRFKLPIYLDDSDANDEYWRWMGSELDEARAADRSAFGLILEEAAQGVEVSMAEAHGLLRVFVEIRLALAARLGVTVEEDYSSLDHTDAVVLDTLAELQLLLLTALRS
ncbi:MAG TPA: DUF2017 family protein [Acidimicrobiia bacterium]|nr:DUF2017 family protein [Acidimicrobiia bacterium]